jgi:hypothetical protein
MSKIYKIEAYIVDPNDDFVDGEECFEYLIDKTRCFCPTPINFKQAEFEWDDDMKINCFGCTEIDCEEMFEEVE